MTAALGDATFLSGDHACRGCRRPVRRVRVDREASRPQGGVLVLVGEWEHLRPTDCAETTAGPVAGYTTQGLAVFRSIPQGDVHPRQVGVAPWHIREPHDSDWVSEVTAWRARQPDPGDAFTEATGTEWWAWE